KYVFPAYRGYREFLSSLLPHARPEDKPGVCFIQGGKEAYAFVIRYHTTIDLSAEELHETGLEELRGIHAEMREIARRSGHAADAIAFMEAVRQDPANFFTTREEIVDCAKALVAETYKRL